MVKIKKIAEKSRYSAVKYLDKGEFLTFSLSSTNGVDRKGIIISLGEKNREKSFNYRIEGRTLYIYVNDSAPNKRKINSYTLKGEDISFLEIRNTQVSDFIKMFNDNINVELV